MSHTYHYLCNHTHHYLLADVFFTSLKLEKFVIVNWLSLSSLSHRIAGVVWSKTTSRSFTSTSSLGSSRCTTPRTSILVSHWSLSPWVSRWASYDPRPVLPTSRQRQPLTLEGEPQKKKNHVVVENLMFIADAYHIIWTSLWTKCMYSVPWFR